MTKSLALTFIQYAADEGKGNAITVLGHIQCGLETVLEAGSTIEKYHAVKLLQSVSFAIDEILKTNAVDIALLRMAKIKPENN